METLNRFDRILAMLTQLQAGRVVKAQELADRFGVSLRTVYRDVKSMEAMGVPLMGEAGVGYSLLDGYRLPPVMFSREEAGSFVAAEKLMQQFSDKSLASAFESAMFKVKSVLRESGKDHIALLENHIDVLPAQELFNTGVPDAMGLILESLAAKKQIRITYQSFHEETATQRHIEPVGLFNENNYWYVLGYCQLRKDYRQFRTDRIFSIQKTDILFSRQHGPVADYRKKPTDVPLTKVVIRMPKMIVKYVQTGRKYYGFVSEKAVGDQVEMTFMTSDIHDGLARWFMMFSDLSEIVEPESFRMRVTELLDKTREKLKIRPELD